MSFNVVPSLKIVFVSLPLIFGFQSILPTATRKKFSFSPMPKNLHSNSPKLIVFDLDNTLWTPELYQLRKLQQAKQTPRAGKDVELFAGAQKVFQKIKNGEFGGDMKFAVASRTQSVDWANDLLDQFDLRDVLDHVEIFPGNKRAHFENIQHASGIAFEDMLFFDDARDGRYGNCEPVSAMGVLSCHCPGGINTYEVFETAMQRYREWDRSPNTIVEWDGTVSRVENLPSGRQQGVVKTINQEKGFGFISYGSKITKDIFFHFSNLPQGVYVERGDELSFTIKKNPTSGKMFASEIESLSVTEEQGMVDMRVFSMNLPFAALLANGYKDLETRNGTMFLPYPEGTQMLLHVGQRIYPDGNRHIDVMKSGGLTDTEISELKSLRKGFSKGAAVAILELGKTYETTVEERSDPEIQRRVAAFGEDSGKMVTEIKKVAYLKRPVKVSGKGGVFKVKIPKSVLPDGWILAPENMMIQKSSPNVRNSGGKGNGEKIIHSITG